MQLRGLSRYATIKVSRLEMNANSAFFDQAAFIAYRHDHE